MTFRQFAYRNVVRNTRVYAAFFMASVFSVAVFFLYSMLLFHPAIENRFVQEIAILGMTVAEIILYIFMFFFLFYSMRAFLQARSKEFGVLLQLGMKRRQLSKLIFMETMILGIAAIVVGTVIGTIFSKLFLMVVREIVALPALPVYFSVGPYALTVGAFLSLFIVIAIIAPIFIKSKEIADLLRGDPSNKEAGELSPIRAYLGLFLLLFSYVLSMLTSNTIVVSLIIFLPPMATFGTYYFFTDSVPYFLQKVKSRRKLYWKKHRLLSISEGVLNFRENAKMYFIVTIVSTVAFMSVGTLASLTSFASQYRELNPLALAYISEVNNPKEQEHVDLLYQELADKGLAYSVVKMPILQQTSSFTKSTVDVIRLSDVNRLAQLMGHPVVYLKDGESLFLPPTQSSFKNLNERMVRTVLVESAVLTRISGAYPYQIFTPSTVGINAIVMNDIDFERAYTHNAQTTASAYHYYAFHVQDWQNTKEVGLAINAEITEAFITGELLPFTFENPGLNYSILSTTFSLILFIGLLLAVFFFLATGSFIYFKLYTKLDYNRKQFELLSRLGITSKELKRIVNYQLMPQFFFPWGIALLHSAFAFLSLQVIWDSLAEISIVKELSLVLAGFTILQILYFYLIRWRYLVHVRAPR